MTSAQINLHDQSGIIKIDDREVPGVRALTMQAAVGQDPHITLELALGRAGLHLDPAEVEVDEDTRKVLEQLGWTPPVVTQWSGQL